MSDEIHKINTRSSYIDNKIAMAYKISKDMPHIIDDLRKQFATTVDMNRDLVFQKVNPPDIQKKYFISNLEMYRKENEQNFLNNNIPIFLKSLVEARVALNEMRKIKLWRWRLQFDPKYKFFLRKSDYIKEKDKIYEKIQENLSQKVNDEISRLMKL